MLSVGHLFQWGAFETGPGRAGWWGQTPTFFALELTFALLVDKAGGQGAEQDGSCQEADGSYDSSQHRPS